MRGARVQLIAVHTPEAVRATKMRIQRPRGPHQCHRRRDLVGAPQELVQQCHAAVGDVGVAEFLHRPCRRPDDPPTQHVGVVVNFVESENIDEPVATGLLHTQQWKLPSVKTMDVRGSPIEGTLGRLEEMAWEKRRRGCPKV